MNTRSIKFQLVVWYAALLTACFLVLGGAAYLALQSYLVGALKQSLLRRGKQISQLLTTPNRAPAAALADEIEARYSPGSNDRFVRVSSGDGSVIYLSSPPKDENFLPQSVPAAVWPWRNGASSRVPLDGGRELLLTSQTVEANGKRFLVETGAPMDDLQSDLHQWLMSLVFGLPAVTLVAVGGGFFLVKRALSPVARLAATAEQISSHNLGERLPVPQTGDELEQLSTALNHMIARLQAAFEHSRRFVADASHELRTPLTVLRGELESFIEEPKLPPEWRDRLGSTLEEVERLVTIVEGLFAISRLDAGEAQAEWVRFDLAQLAVSTADQMSLLGEDKHIKLSCAAPGPVWVEGDRARMKQVVVNLLDNAIKYTPDGGSVGLTVSSRGARALLEVADNGAGIPEEALPRVFERFYRVDKARSRELGGAGLGLSIVKSICAAHQGVVEALSTPGSGSIFRVELPLASPPLLKSNGL